jgi:hypothetical protein
VKGWRTTPEGSYFPCVCGERVETMERYYRHMDFCMTGKRQDYLAAVKTAIREGSRGERIEELLAGEESWNSPARPASYSEWHKRIRVLQDRAMDEQTIIVLVPQAQRIG